MLNENEFAIENLVPATLSSDVAEFAMFTIDLGDVLTLKMRDANGKRVMKNAYPHLKGKGVQLWKVKPAATMSVTRMRQLQAEQNELDRQANLARYIKQGYAFDELALSNPHDGGCE